MDHVLEQALLLLLSGMLTVFIVLGLVVLLGKALIAIVNKLAPQVTDPRTLPAVLPIPSQIEPNVLAVIAAAVDVATAGQGQAKGIKKLPINNNDA